MKKILAAADNSGTYDTVDVLEDRYRVNGAADLPFTVIGQGEISDVVDGDFPPPPYVEPVIEVPPNPTKEELMAELAVLSAKIQALT